MICEADNWFFVFSTEDFDDILDEDKKLYLEVDV